MAKILLVAEKLTPTVVRLTVALKNQQHQVTVLTSKGEDTALPEGIEILTPFRRWSLREGLTLLPVLMALNPQVVHLVLNEDRLRPAQVILSLFAKSLPRAVLTTSILHIRHGLRRRNPVRYLLQESDVVTCPSAESLGALRGLNIRPLRQGRGILPPVLDFGGDEAVAEKSASTTELLARFDRNFLVLPFSEPEFDAEAAAFRRLTLIASHRPVILLGSFAHWPLRDRKRFHAWMQKQGLASQWALSGELSPPDLRRVLAAAEALILAGQGMSPLEITDHFLHALQAGVTLILDDRQAMLHADLWRDGENCWILPQDDLLARLQSLLSRSALRRPQSLPDGAQLQRELTDAPLNELNRLYNKALSLKHLGSGPGYY